ncbi:PadR family transcriptional regulator [Clostridium botulinum]|nr:PadR family transcriptional regulator [Clostridium botulinum]EKO2043446.1 PadR family transcriptional regulator [Clostridium botulinum]
MDKEIMKGSIDILILTLINKDDLYGYKISKIIKKKSNMTYSMGEGTLYPALKRLESKKLIKSYWQDNDLSGKRKYYSITPLGKSVLKEKLAQWNNITKLITICMED